MSSIYLTWREAFTSSIVIDPKAINLVFVLFTEEPPTQSVVLCGEQNFTLECPDAGDVLHIYDAFYGFDAELALSAVCLMPPGVEAGTVCASPEDATSRVKNICDGRPDCFYRPDNTMFGDLCPFLQQEQKVSRVRYTCQSKSTLKL